MLPSPTLRRRVTSGTAAIGVQAGLLMLLLYSFNVVRQAVEEKESILVLPPLARPLPPPPAVIDARRPAQPSPSQALPAQNPVPPLPAAPPVPALPAAPGDAFSIAPSQAGIDCGAPGRGTCPTPHAGSPSDEIERNPPSHVQNAPVWESEIERRNTPPRVPCVSATSGTVGTGGLQREDHGVRLDLTCALQKWRNPALLPPVASMPVADPGPRHASDEAFDKALAAANARQRMLAPAAVPPASGAAP